MSGPILDNSDNSGHGHPHNHHHHHSHNRNHNRNQNDRRQNSIGPSSAMDIVDAYKKNSSSFGEDDENDVTAVGSLDFNSNVQVPIRHLSARLETISSSPLSDHVAQTAPSTPLPPHYLKNGEMKAMSEASLFIPDSVTTELITSDDNIHNLTKNLAASSKNWEERGAAKIIKTEKDENGNLITKIIKKSAKDFKFGKSLGEGSYSTVILATDKTTDKNYAIKVLDKRHIIKEKKVKYVNIEKNTLNRLGKRNGIIHLYFTFQDESSLYFVLDYAPNGELLTLIKKFGSMNEECVRYYGAQVLDGVKYMHDNGVIHRDLKPENILIDSQMRAQITDFGTAKLLEKDENGRYPSDARAKSFVGTAEYVSPELLNDKYAGKACDIWAYGCIIYQMIAGKPPFKATNEYLTFQKVCKLQYAFTAGFPAVLRDLVKKILVLNPKDRATIKTIQNHYFYQGINWSDSDSIFEAPLPELSPYKVTAKSMMPVPELNINNNNNNNTNNYTRLSTRKHSASSNSLVSSNQPSTPQLGLPLSAKLQASSSSVSAPTTPNQSNQSGPPSTPPKKSQQSYVLPGKSASSAAAAALMKKPAEIMINSNNNSSNTSTGESNQATSGRTVYASGSDSSQDLYIPGTNILRPVIKSRISAGITTGTASNNNNSSGNNVGFRSKSSSSMRESSSSKNTRYIPQATEVPQMGPVDLAWSEYLKHPDERVLKVGPVMVTQISTAQFEKKYKGMLADSPLGYNNGRRSSNASATSFLTQVAHGKQPGLRHSSSPGIGSNAGNQQNQNISTISEDDSDEAIVYSAADEEVESEKSKESKSNESNVTTGGKFRKVFSGLTGGAGSHNTSSTDHEASIERTLLVTTFGRALILKFEKNKTSKNKTELKTEIDLTNPAIKFKEVIGDRRVKNSITTGLFAIESLKVTISCEVEKQEVIKWTTSLAKSKSNEEDRRLRESIESEVGSVSNATAAIIAAKVSSSSPVFANNGSATSDTTDFTTDSPTSPKIAIDAIKDYDLKAINQLLQSASSNKSHRSSMEEQRQKSTGEGGGHDSRRPRRKPPPPTENGDGLKPGHNRSISDNALIAGAINTAMRNPEINPSSGNNYRSSSFVSSNRKVSPSAQVNSERHMLHQRHHHSHNSDSGNNSNPNSAGSPKKLITSLNSKFLARSQRKK